LWWGLYVIEWAHISMNLWAEGQMNFDVIKKGRVRIENKVKILNMNPFNQIR
jgi:hypothetical protein